jgi:hypothetical protein
MGVDLRRSDVAVSEQFLQRADVISGLEQVRREGVSKCVAGRRRFYAGGANGRPHLSLN